MKGNEAPLKNKHVDKFISRFNTFMTGAAGSNRGEIQKWLAEDYKIIRRGYLALKKEQEVCTIMHPQTTQKLNSFFYIPKISVSKRKNENISPLCLVTNSSESGVLILGRLGQGKSMFFRYLQFIALNCGETIPIFLEFRKIRSNENIEDAAYNKLNSLGFECSVKLFNYLLSNGYLTIFLDGYDEIQFDKRVSFDISITNIMNMTTGNKIYITSRYGTDVEKLPGLKKYEIQPLNEDDHPQFIKKLLKGDNESDEIIKKTHEAKEFDSTVLDTPLLLTWFIMVYKNRKKIPKTKIGFYEELFRTILSRHDGIKGSFDRPSKSGLADSEIELILHAFCYITSKYDEKDFEHKTIIDRIQQAINITKLPNVDAEAYLYDLTNITCLIIKDGLSYHFIHGTIQRYFSACFIKDTNEENASKFYISADSDWAKWGDELSFLHTLDRYRFHKFMIVPSIEKLTNTTEKNIIKNKGLTKLSESAIKSIYSESCLVFNVKNLPAPLYISTVYVPAHSYTCHLIFNNANYKLCPSDHLISQYMRSHFKKNKDFELHVHKLAKGIVRNNDDTAVALDLIKTLSSSSHVHDFCESVEDKTVDIINSMLRSSISIINAEEAKQELF